MDDNVTTVRPIGGKASSMLYSPTTEPTQASPQFSLPPDFDEPMKAKFQEIKAKGYGDEDASYIVREMKNAGKFDVKAPEQGIGGKLADSFKQSATGFVDTVGGAAEKAKESFVEGSRKIGTGIYRAVNEPGQVASGLTESAVGLGRAVTAPIAGAIGQAQENLGNTLYATMPEGNNAIESFGKGVEDLSKKESDFQNSLDPVQKQRYQDIKNALELGSYFVGGKAAPGIVKGAEEGVTSVKNTIGSTLEGAKNVKLPEVPSIKQIKGKIGETGTNLGNATAEQLLSSQWKMDKATKRGIQNATGKTPEKFALENDLVGRDIEATSENAANFKLKNMEDKLKATESMGETENVPQARRMAQSVRDELEDSVIKFSGNKKAKSISELTPEELSLVPKTQLDVIKAMDSFIASDKVQWRSVEAVKNLYDHYNPDNIKWGLDGKPERTALSEGSAEQRGVVQHRIEQAALEKGFDIAKMNQNIQAAHALEVGADSAAGRMANHNLVGLGDTQIGTLAAIVGDGGTGLGAVLFKKGIADNQGIRASIARRLYTKDPANVTDTPLNRMNGAPPITRVDRILGNMNNRGNSADVTPKIRVPEPVRKAVSAQVKRETGIKQPKTTNVQAKDGVRAPEPVRASVSAQIKRAKPLGTNQKTDGTVKTAVAPAKSERPSALSLAKSNKGFIDPKKIAEDLGIAKNGKVGKELEPLAEEARKYKSAEEFLKAKEAKGEVFYHGTNKDFHFSDFNETKRGSLGETGRTAYFLTNDPSEAIIYAKEAVFQTKNGTPTIKKLLLNTDKIKRLPEGQSTAKTERLELARKEGYDAVMDDRGNIAVFDKRFIVEPKDLFKK